MATIRKRQGKWQVQIRHIGHKQISKTFNRKQEAEQWARELEVSFDQNKLEHKVFEYPLFSKIIERYTNEISAKKRGHNKNSSNCLKYYTISEHGNSRVGSKYFFIPYFGKARKLES
tara:strand:+ start:534 stop:884 length:351 start_codon:yes stop_codon:yes gene_type:complete